MEERQPGTSAMVLVVDDEPAVRSVLSRGLAHHGYEVVVADGGAAALVALSRRRGFAAVVTDLNMPEMDGDELASVILREYPGIPVVFVTAGAPSTALLAEPLVSLLDKPLRTADIHQRLTEVIDRALPRHVPASA